MELENPNTDQGWLGFIVTVFLAAVTGLSRVFNFSLSGFIYKISHFSLSVSLSTMMDISVSDAQNYVDQGFHYLLYALSLVLVCLKISNELKRRKKL